MDDYDVFNGDADGICSLIQLRLANPQKTQLITGVKRDISLLKQVPKGAGRVTVLDISIDKNNEALGELLYRGTEVFYVDHHKASNIPEHENFESHIDTSPEVCTALIVDKYLNGQYRSWALTAAFGDNLKNEARQIAEKVGFSEEEIDLMDKLGTYINYNGYGASLDDLFFHPADLYEKMSAFVTPFDFIEECGEIFNVLSDGYQSDMAQAAKLVSFKESNAVAMYVLPNKKWARRVSGVYSNSLANKSPEKAHAVLTEGSSGTFLVSIRAPKENPYGASEIAMKFPAGGGREAAAGINSLPSNMLEQLFEELNLYY